MTGRRRRDPRAERAARLVPGGARPRLAVGPVAAETGGRVRRDPRAERAALLVPGTMRARIDRGGAAGADRMPVGASPVAAVARPVSAGDASRRVMVVADAVAGRLTRHDRQLLGAARMLADPQDGAAVLVLTDDAAAAGDTALVEAAAAAGADAVALVVADDDPEQVAARVAAVIRRLEPMHVLFAETASGGDLARRVAVLLGEALLCGLEALSPRAAVRAARSGRVERHQAPARLMTLQPDRVAAYRGPVRDARLLPAADPVDTAVAGRLVVRDIAGDPASHALSEAPFVLSAGSGVTDLDGFGRLAARLGATPGASRVLCDAGLMPRAAQVGASGTVLSGDCYVALGISGAPQHLQGIGVVPHVVAVNIDLHAAMVARAELAIIGDAKAVMQAMLTLLETGQ